MGGVVEEGGRRIERSRKLEDRIRGIRKEVEEERD